MSPSSSTAHLLFLDLRSNKSAPAPAIDGLLPVNPVPNSDCPAALSASMVLVALDSLAAYDEWRQRYHPMCPTGFPHVILFDPYCPTLARQAMREDAADCCALEDTERLELIVARLQRNQSPNVPRIPDDTTLLLRMQTSFDTLPSPIFIKNREGRYIACNKAFEDYLGLPRSKIIGSTVYDVAPLELARIYEKADRELMARGGTQSYEANVRYADGSRRDVMFHKSVFLDNAGAADGISGTMLDITDRKLLEKKLETAASTDFLTGIDNLRTFYELGGREFRRLSRHGGDLSLVIIDLDYFKEINDTLGHAAGDDALKKFVAVVQTQLRDQDIFARAGGDEFRLLLPDTLPASAAIVADRIRQAINQITIANEAGKFRLSISAGICSCLPGDHSLDDVTRRADAALYMAKAAGRNCVHPKFSSP